MFHFNPGGASRKEAIMVALAQALTSPVSICPCCNAEGVMRPVSYHFYRLDGSIAPELRADARA